MSENGITTETLFHPTEGTTRGQFATFLMRSHNALKNPIAPSPNPDPIEPDPTPVIPKAVFVEELLPLHFTTIQLVQLPQTVEVTFNEGSKKMNPVVW
ncbi:hypothetical protein MKY34_21775 [Sporosarcina sp. FSL K6-1522]|uniref:hypothetical protein n=1 Tax=Sporosarcina sp. FSL K6-1522 TaxID=2921554 RepID=UPI00315A6DD2